MTEEDQYARPHASVVAFDTAAFHAKLSESELSDVSDLGTADNHADNRLSKDSVDRRCQINAAGAEAKQARDIHATRKLFH